MNVGITWESGYWCEIIGFQTGLGGQDRPCVALQIAAVDRLRPSRLYGTPNNLLALSDKEQQGAHSDIDTDTQYTQ